MADPGRAKLRGAALCGLLTALACLLFLRAVINQKPIAGDGRQNLAAGLSLVRHGVFSTTGQEGRAPRSDMFREPAWPVWTAGVLLVSGRSAMPLEKLASKEHNLLFKLNNALFLSILAGLAAGTAWYWARRPLIASLVASTVAVATLATTPRLVNMYNNEPLAMLLLLMASILFVAAFQGSRRAALGLGVALGFLALTKAQFLFAGVVPVIALAFASRRRAAWALVAFAFLVSPWIARNALLFGKPAISERGKTVAAVRLSLLAQHLPSERACMLYAFTHPRWRPFVGEMISVEARDFDRGGACERLCREFRFDMGKPVIICNEPYPEDKEAVRSRKWQSAVQYFWDGMVAGREIEEGRMRLTDIAPLTPRTLGRYLLTFPLYAWRGWAFSGSPWLSLALSLSVFALLLTRWRAFSLFAAAAHLMHIALTHNIPRYHAVEFGVMFVALALVVDAAADRVWGRLAPEGKSRDAGGGRPGVT